MIFKCLIIAKILPLMAAEKLMALPNAKKFVVWISAEVVVCVPCRRSFTFFVKPNKKLEGLNYKLG